MLHILAIELATSYGVFFFESAPELVINSATTGPQRVLTERFFNGANRAAFKFEHDHVIKLSFLD